MMKIRYFILPVVFLLMISLSVTAVTAQEKRMIIVYKDAVTDNDIKDLENSGAKIIYRYELIPAVAVIVPDQPSAAIASGASRTVYDDLPIEAALSQSVPQIKANLVQQEGVTGSGVKVCILDSGIDHTHPALSQPILEHDFVNNDDDASDDNLHGTFMAGLIASKDSTYRGVAPGASLMIGKVLNFFAAGLTSDVMIGIDWCVANGADIISMSLQTQFLSGGNCDDQPLAASANNAVDQGVVVVAISGNFGQPQLISMPGCASKVITVGAVDSNDFHADFSDGGSELDVVAPGVAVTSTALGGGFSANSGTSVSGPHVAGTAALMLQANPLLTPGDVANILKSTAKDLGPAGFDNLFGYGRVDAFAAYEVAKDFVPSNNNPVAKAGPDQTVTDNDGNGVEQVTLDGSSSFDPDGSITSFEWKESSTVLGTTSVISPNFNIGIHDVNLKVTDNQGATGTDTVRVTVNPQPGVNIPPVANAGPDRNVVVGQNIVFDGTSSFDSDGTIISYEWDFGDGATATGSVVSHSYSQEGNFEVALTVTDDDSASDQDTANINAANSLVVFFEDFQNGFGKWTKSARWISRTPAEIEVPDSEPINIVAHADRCKSACSLYFKSFIDLTPYSSATLKFKRFVDDDIDNKEYLKVQAYNGKKWITLAQWIEGNGDDNTWHDEVYDLSGFLSKKFKLKFIGKHSVFDEEVEVDDIVIEAVPK